MTSNLKQKRENAGLSQKGLAELSGVSIRNVQFYEQGRLNIDGAKLDTLLSLGVALKCPISDIVQSEELKNKCRQSGV